MALLETLDKNIEHLGRVVDFARVNRRKAREAYERADGALDRAISEYTIAMRYYAEKEEIR